MLWVQTLIHDNRKPSFVSALALVLSSFEDEAITLSNPDLGRLAGMSARTVGRAKAWLIAHDYLSATESYGKSTALRLTNPSQIDLGPSSDRPRTLATLTKDPSHTDLGPSPNGGDYRGGDSKLRTQIIDKPENPAERRAHAREDPAIAKAEMAQALTPSYANAPHGVVIDNGQVRLVNGTRALFLKRFGGSDEILAEKLLGCHIEPQSRTCPEVQVLRQMSAAADLYAKRMERSERGKPRKSNKQLGDEVVAQLIAEARQ